MSLKLDGLEGLKSKYRKEWMDTLRQEWQGRKVAVWGAGVSGVAATRLLCKLGAQVTLSDPNPKCSVDPQLQNKENVEIYLGQGNVINQADLVILSPGIPPHHPSIQALKNDQIPFMSELELGARCAQHPLIGITGTDGKSTTTQWIQNLLTHLGRPAVAVGNIGDPICNHVLSEDPDLILVVEVSAFQLWSTDYFPAQIAILTNIAQDHYPYFTRPLPVPQSPQDAVEHSQSSQSQTQEKTSTQEPTPSQSTEQLSLKAERVTKEQVVLEAESAYIASKLRLFDLAAEQALLLWPDLLDLDAWVDQGRLASSIAKRCHRYGLLKSSTWSAHQSQYWNQSRSLFSMNQSPLIGRHNHRNALAVLASGSAFGFSETKLQSAFVQFQGLEHRMERVILHQGVTWINDSKATNIHAACAGLASTDSPLVVIAGGYNKGLDLTEFVRLLSQRARGVCCIGQTGPLLFEALKSQDQSQNPIERSPLLPPLKLYQSQTLENAIQDAYTLAQEGDLVILSPATSSFDQFKSFEHRGEVFKESVLAFLTETL